MTVRTDIKVSDWINIKYNGKTYLVAVKSLITAWMHEQSVRNMDE